MIAVIENNKNKLPMPYQEEYLLLVEEKLDSGDMNCAFGFRFHADIDKDKLEAAIAMIAQENDALRMKIVKEDGKYYQYCEDSIDFSLEMREPSGDTAEERYNKAYQEMLAEIKQRMPIGDEHFLWTSRLYKIDTEDYVLMFNLHHAISDGYSAGIITEKLKKYYPVLCSGKTPESIPAADYMEFIKTDLELSAKDKGKKQMEYWRNELDGYKELDLTPFIKEDDEKKMTRIVNIDLSQIDRAAKKSGTTHFAVLMTAYHIAISKATGVNDTVIGFACANRNEKRFRNTIGFLTRAVQNRLIINENLSLRELVKTNFRKISENVSNQNIMVSGTTDNSKSLIQFHCTYSPTVFDSNEMRFDGKPYEIVQFITEHRVDFLTSMVYEYDDHIMLLFVADTRFIGSELIENVSRGIAEGIRLIDECGDMLYKDITF